MFFWILILNFWTYSMTAIIFICFLPNEYKGKLYQMYKFKGWERRNRKHAETSVSDSEKNKQTLDTVWDSLLKQTKNIKNRQEIKCFDLWNIPHDNRLIFGLCMNFIINNEMPCYSFTVGNDENDILLLCGLHFHVTEHHLKLYSCNLMPSTAEMQYCEKRTRPFFSYHLSSWYKDFKLISVTCNSIPQAHYVWMWGSTQDVYEALSCFGTDFRAWINRNQKLYILYGLSQAVHEAIYFLSPDLRACICKNYML